MYPFSRSLVDYAAFQLCTSHPIYSRMDLKSQSELYAQCGANWKRVWWFLQSVEQSSETVKTSSGNVFTCGDNSSSCCGHRDTSRPIFRPRLVEALKGAPCKQVAAGLNFTVFLTRQGHVYACGINTYGQLGHGDTQDRPTPKIIEVLGGISSVVQIAAGPSYVLAVMENGLVYSFGSGANFCLGHGEQHSEFLPRAIQAFRIKGIHVVHVSAGDEHAVALDLNGFVSFHRQDKLLIVLLYMFLC